jgi:hypothetical protein
VAITRKWLVKGALIALLCSMAVAQETARYEEVAGEGGANRAALLHGSCSGNCTVWVNAAPGHHSVDAKRHKSPLSRKPPIR